MRNEFFRKRFPTFYIIKKKRKKKEAKKKRGTKKIGLHGKSPKKPKAFIGTRYFPSKKECPQQVYPPFPAKKFKTEPKKIPGKNLPGKN